MKKSKNKNFKNSISFKLNISISLTLLIIFAILTTYSSYKNYNSAVETSKALVQKDAKEFGFTVEKTFIETHSSVQSLYNAVNNHMALNKKDRNRSQIAKILKNIVEDNDDILVGGIYFEANAFDGLDKNKIGSKYANSKGRFAIISYRNGDKIEEAVSDNVDDPDKNQFYVNAINADKLFITEPAFDDLGEKEVLTYNYTIPLKENGETIGIVLCGVSVEGLQKQISEYKGSFDQTYFILNSYSGNMIAHGTKSKNRMKNILKLHETWKNNFDKAQNGELSHITEYSNTTKQDNVYTFAPVNIKGSDKKWIIQSATPLKYFVAEAKQNMYINILSYVIALILVIVLIIILVKNIISKPLVIIQSAMEKIADYNLDTSEERNQAKKWVNNRDEIGRMLRSIKLMVNNLKSIVENISSNASNTAATSEELTATAQSTNESAREVASAVSNIAEGATGQAHDTTEAAQNIEENTKSLNEMIKMLKELEQSTIDIDNKKNEGKIALNGLTKLSEENKEESIFINQIIQETNESAANISKASEMIQSIADQTNLLALNAAIEAARAGEAGKGFAVVAEEIRKLAEDSTKFTEEIRLIINELREKSDIAVFRMEKAADIVEKSDAQNKITKDKFDEIEKAVEKSKVIVDKIHDNSKNIEEKNTQIIGVIQNLSAIAEENAATTEEASASVETQTQSISDISNASSSLAEIANELQNEVSRFNL